MDHTTMAERKLPRYHPEQLTSLVGNENTELPDDVVEAMLNIMRVYADPESAPYNGYYTPAQIELYSSQNQPTLTPLPANRDILHIHNLGNHWVTTFHSAVHRTVFICDSLRTPIHTHQIEKQVKLIYGNLAAKIEHVAVVQQSTQPLCGPLAIAFAVAYFLKTDPSKLQFDLSKVNKHLKNCIELGEVTQFPTVNLLSSYFTNQFEMQQEKRRRNIHANIKVHEKRRLQKELDRIRKQNQRANLNDSEKKNQKEKDRVRKRNERQASWTEIEKQIEKDKTGAVRKQNDSNSKQQSECGEQTVKEIHILRKRLDRKKRSETEKKVEIEEDVLRKRSKIDFKQQQQVIKQSDSAKKQEEVQKQSECGEHSDSETKPQKKEPDTEIEVCEFQKQIIKEKKCIEKEERTSEKIRNFKRKYERDRYDEKEIGQKEKIRN